MGISGLGKWRRRFIVPALLVSGVTLPHAAPLLITYIEKPPYYHTERDQPAGFLLQSVRYVFDKAEIPVQFASRPAKRALMEIEQGNEEICSIGWFKTEERLAFSRFSLPIHQDKPMAVLTGKAHETTLRQYATLRELLGNRALRMGAVSGFSYGRDIDQWLIERGENIERAAVTPIINLKKLALGRIDFTIVDVRELSYLFQQAEVARSQLAEISYPDIPAGGVRHLMCSKKVDEARMAKINAAIRILKLAPEVVALH